MDYLSDGMVILVLIERRSQSIYFIRSQLPLESLQQLPEGDIDEFTVFIILLTKVLVQGDTF